MRTLPELVSTLTTDLATLVRKESELVRTEMGEKLSTAGKAAGEVAAGGILLLAALHVLLAALVVALAKFIGDVWAALLVGLVVAGVLCAIFLLMPGNWNWRITLAVAGAFGLFTFVSSLLSAWAVEKVTARLPK